MDYQTYLDMLESDIRELRDYFTRLRRCVNAKDPQTGEFFEFSASQEEGLKAHIECVNVSTCNLHDVLYTMEKRIKR